MKNKLNCISWFFSKFQNVCYSYFIELFFFIVKAEKCFDGIHAFQQFISSTIKYCIDTGGPRWMVLGPPLLLILKGIYLNSESEELNVSIGKIDFSIIFWIYYYYFFFSWIEIKILVFHSSSTIQLLKIWQITFILSYQRGSLIQLIHYNKFVNNINFIYL